MIFSDCNMSSFYLEHMLMLNVSAILIKLQDIITDGAKSSDNEQLTQAEREKDRDRERERGRRRDREREGGERWEDWQTKTEMHRKGAAVLWREAKTYRIRYSMARVCRYKV